MPRFIDSPSRVPVRGDKQIDEYVGRLNTLTAEASVAHMRSPAGWSEPFQAPEFDEITVVLQGAVVVEHDGVSTTVAAGQAVVTRAGDRVRYSTPEGAEYVSICRPAFDPNLANREPERG